MSTETASRVLHGDEAKSCLPCVIIFTIWPLHKDGKFKTSEPIAGVNTRQQPTVACGREIGIKRELRNAVTPQQNGKLGEEGMTLYDHRKVLTQRDETAEVSIERRYVDQHLPLQPDPASLRWDEHPVRGERHLST